MNKTIKCKDKRHDEQRSEPVQTAQTVCALTQHCTTSCLCPDIIASATMSSAGFDAARCGNEKEVYSARRSFVLRTQARRFVLRTQAAQATMSFGQKLHKQLKVSTLSRSTVPPAICPVIAAVATMSGAGFEAAGCGKEKMLLLQCCDIQQMGARRDLVVC